DALSIAVRPPVACSASRLSESTFANVRAPIVEGVRLTRANSVKRRLSARSARRLKASTLVGFEYDAVKAARQGFVTLSQVGSCSGPFGTGSASTIGR